ncbi:MAG TPA: MOSC domain-containing protein [Hansschlegelia sp.]
MTHPTGRIVALRRFPVKGLSAEPLSAVAVEAGKQIEGDRAFAIENGPSGFDPESPAFIPKFKFLCLMKNERLASLATSFDPACGLLTVRRDGEVALEADLRSDDGKRAVEAWFSEFMGEELNGPLKVLPAPGEHTFSDTALGVVSIINRASVAAVEDMVGRPVDPLRFRGNIEIEGFGPWEELDWVGRELIVGAVRMKIVKRTVRCAATNVDPITAERDMKIPATLMKTLGHADCGVYGEVVAGGLIEVGAPVELV